MRAEMLRYGEWTRAGEYAYDHPFLLGSRRIGPDLQRVGGKYPDAWHYEHMRDPRSTSPGSIMPSYAWLLRQRYRPGRTSRPRSGPSAVGRAVHRCARSPAHPRRCGRRPGRSWPGSPQAGIKTEPDREIMALIAYLQRLGKDGTAAIAAARGPTQPPARGQPHESASSRQAAESVQLGWLMGVMTVLFMACFLGLDLVGLGAAATARAGRRTAGCPSWTETSSEQAGAGTRYSATPTRPTASRSTTTRCRTGGWASSTLTIVWAVVYVAYYHFIAQRSDVKALAAEMADGREALAPEPTRGGHGGPDAGSDRGGRSDLQGQLRAPATAPT